MTQEDKFVIVQYLKHTKIIIFCFLIWGLISILFFTTFYKHNEELKFVIKFESNTLKPIFYKGENNQIKLPLEFLLSLKTSINDSVNYDYSIESLEPLVYIKEFNSKEWFISTGIVNVVNKRTLIDIFKNNLDQFIKNQLQDKINQDYFLLKANNIKLDTEYEDEKISNLVLKHNFMKSLLAENKYGVKLLHIYKGNNGNILKVISFFLTSILVYFALILSGIYFFRIKKYHLIFIELFLESKNS